MLVAVLFSAPVNGTRRWFGVGGLGIQPSELAKIACVFFTALILERRMHRIDDLSYSLMPIGLIIGLVIALILLQPDFGTSISLALVVAVMIFAPGLHYRYFVGLALVALPAIYLVLVAAPYRRGRHGRRLRPRTHGRRPEAVLSPGAAHRFHLRCHRRGARSDRRDRDPAL